MKVTLYPALTLDGFIANLDGECDSWIGDDDEAAYDQAIAEAGCVLLGRKTYDQYRESFPMKQGTTFVHTTHHDYADDDKVKFVHGSPREILDEIASYGFDHVIVGGGGEVNGSLADAGLIDEIIASVYNLTLGEGIRLFGSHNPKLKLKLISAEQGEGFVKNHYRVEK